MKRRKLNTMAMKFETAPIYLLSDVFGLLFEECVLPIAENEECDGKEAKEYTKTVPFYRNNRNSVRIDSLRHCFPNSEFSRILTIYPWWLIYFPNTPHLTPLR